MNWFDLAPARAIAKFSSCPSMASAVMSGKALLARVIVVTGYGEGSGEDYPNLAAKMNLLKPILGARSQQTADCAGHLKRLEFRELS